MLVKKPPACSPGAWVFCHYVRESHFGYGGRRLLIDLFCVEPEDGVFVGGLGFMRACEGDWGTVSDPETGSINPSSIKRNARTDQSRYADNNFPQW